jgi:hypothetical protein
MKWKHLTPILAPIRWAVVGAVATRLYMPERSTQDLDIAVLFDDGAEVRRKLSVAGFVHQRGVSCYAPTYHRRSSWRAPDGETIDVLEVRESWWEEALSEAQTNLDPEGLPVLPLRYLILMKVQAGRVQDLADAARMLGQASQESLSSIRALFARYAPADAEDLESLIALGQLEMQPPPREGDEKSC